MDHGKRLQVINDFLGSAHVFSLAVNELMEQKIRETIGSELTLSQLKLLKLVSKTNAEKISDVAGFLGVSHPAASKAVDRLVRRGLVDRKEDAVDPAVGIVMKKRLGDRVAAGEALCELRVSGKSDVGRALMLLAGAVEIGDRPVEKPPLIHAVIGV